MESKTKIYPLWSLLTLLGVFVIAWRLLVPGEAFPGTAVGEIPNDGQVTFDAQVSTKAVDIGVDASMLEPTLRKRPTISTASSDRLEVVLVEPVPGTDEAARRSSMRVLALESDLWSTGAGLHYEGHDYRAISNEVTRELSDGNLTVLVREPYQAIWVSDLRSGEWLEQGGWVVREGMSFNSLFPSPKDDSRAVMHPLGVQDGPIEFLPLLRNRETGDQGPISVGSRGYAWHHLLDEDLDKPGLIVALDSGAKLSINIRSHRPVPDLNLYVKGQNNRRLFTSHLSQVLPQLDDLISLQGLPEGPVIVELRLAREVGKSVRSQDITLVAGRENVVSFDVSQEVNREQIPAIVGVNLPEALSHLEMLFGDPLVLSMHPSVEATLNGARLIHRVLRSDSIQADGYGANLEIPFNEGLYQGSYEVVLSPFGRLGTINIGPEEDYRQSVTAPPLGEMRVEVIGLALEELEHWKWQGNTLQGDKECSAKVVQEDSNILFVYGLPGKLRLTAIYVNPNASVKYMVRRFSLDLPGGTSRGEVKLTPAVGCRIESRRNGQLRSISTEEWSEIQILNSLGKRDIGLEMSFEGGDRRAGSYHSVIIHGQRAGDYRFTFPATKERSRVEWNGRLDETFPIYKIK